MGKRSSTWPAGAWKPVLQGSIYCSPACGGRRAHGCTKQNYDRAGRLARKLARRLGPEWEPHVWENLGWHWSVRAPHLNVHPNGGGSFTAFLSAERDCLGGQWTARASDPQEAIRLVTEAARKELHSLSKMLFSAGART